MKVLIPFATVEGQTGKIARFIADEVTKLGHDYVLVDTDDTEEIKFKGIDAVILAAPVHQRRHPKSFEVFLQAAHEPLSKLDTLMISVSLSAAFPAGLEEAAEYLTEMKMRTNFSPSAEILTAGAVRISKYDYFAMQVIRHVVLRNHEYDASAGEHEFTDWDALATGVAEFLA